MAVWRDLKRIGAHYLQQCVCVVPHRPDLREAVDELEKDDVLRRALGEHVLDHFVEAKRAEWREYNATVHAWELERYLDLI